MSKPNATLEAHMRSLASQTRTQLPVLGQSTEAASGAAAADPEFAHGADTLVISGQASRRKFMGMLGASTALAGLSSTGCIRKPKEKILPFAKRPEDRIPGKPMYYATAFQAAGTVVGLLVESQDGRPTKVEGNPQHSGSRGKADAWAQASVLSLYDPERSTKPMSRTTAAYAMPKVGKSAGVDELEDSAIKQLCKDTYERVLDSTRSIDNAKSAAQTCKSSARERGKWALGTTEDGRKYAAITLEGPEQTESDWTTLWGEVEPELANIIKAQGDKTALVIAGSMSPSYRGLVRAFKTRNNKSRVFLCDSSAPVHGPAAVEALAGAGARAHYDLSRAKVVLAADCDFLGTEVDHVRLAGEYAKARKVEKPGDEMSRLYAVEPHLTTTGAQADNRLRLKAGRVADFLGAVAHALTSEHGLSAPGGAAAFAAALPKGSETLDAKAKKFASAVAKDLASHKAEAAVLVGERQDVGVHAMGLYINALLGGLAHDSGAQRVRSGKDILVTEPLSELAAGLADGKIEKVICLGANPAYDAPGSLDLAQLLATKAKVLIHAGLYRDETAQLAHWHIPVSHYLESWSDLEAADGTKSVCQPLIAPMYDTPSLLEVLARAVAPERQDDGHKLVRDYWTYAFGDKKFGDKQWRQWLHDGVIGGAPNTSGAVNLSGWDALAKAVQSLPKADAKAIEVNFHVDPKVATGEFANNAWLQECPHPVTKMVWDNAAYISQKFAESMRVENGDNLSIKLDGRAVSVPAWIAPGQADDTVSISLGYGRRNVGTVAEGAGVDVNIVRSHEAPFITAGSVERGSGRYDLVTTQDYGSLDPDGPDGGPLMNYPARPIYRETTVDGFEKDPEFANEGDLMPDDRLRALWDMPKLTGSQQWGMSIDLNSCTGCNACVMACQAENNIPTVGKAECGNGREMHWIRIDRYYTGDQDEPEAVLQPLACQHCETAPCENVCPVAATTHSPEGLNDIAYNRCVGTRYCANNCPYKVRRFNFFNYNKDLNPVEQLQKNPDVTVRFRGVIEKCTYCVQRINEAKIAAHVKGKAKVRDGDIITACQQTCPTDAIVFGDIKDSKTRVSKLKAQSRDYALLKDLFTLPRTTFLGRVRNPNPELG